jgi:hypothetical protein
MAMLRGLSAPLAVLAAALAISACGDDAPDTDGGLTASELAAKLPDGGIPQAVAVDVDAAREAAGLPADADPAEVGTSREELRFGFSTFFALRDLAALTDNPVRAALDHGQISAYAAHPYVLDEAITLVSSSQDFDEISTTLEDDGWKRDGAVVSAEGNPEELTYTAVGAGDGFLVLGYDPGVVEAVASGEAPPSETGELAGLEALDAPVAAAVVPETEGTECIELIAFEDFVDETFTLYITVDGKAKSSRLDKNLAVEAKSLGFDIASKDTEGDTITLKLKGVTETEQLVNSPAVLVGATLDEDGPLIYDCG